ncbi:MAG: oligopeptide/dipeptide ABC transporter ATP-binding protein [Caldimonas sp.]
MIAVSCPDSAAVVPPRVDTDNTGLPLMQANALTREFTLRAGMFQPKRTLHAVNGVSLSIGRGDVLGIVGESGCGKSTLARLLLGLLPPSSGHIKLGGTELRQLDRKAIARRVQPVFQDPYASLNPRRDIASIVALPLDVHGLGDAAERRRQSIAMLERVGLPARYAHHTPGQLSGGQRQRVAIARALVMRPEIVICDEPTSALDVSVQAQILNLLMDLRREFGLTYVFISHNLAVVEHIATQVAVMYLGQIVEQAPTAALFRAPRHPYTQALLKSVLTPEPGLGVPDTGLGLAFPDPLNPPPGCPFHPRCPQRLPECSSIVPLLTRDALGAVSCHLVTPIETTVAMPGSSVATTVDAGAR